MEYLIHISYGRMGVFIKNNKKRRVENLQIRTSLYPHYLKPNLSRTMERAHGYPGSPMTTGLPTTTELCIRGNTVRRKLSIALLLSLALAGCMSSPVKEDDTRECARNFEKQGVKNYRTSVTLEGVDKKLAINGLVRELGRKGFEITKNDPAAGYVNATFDAGKSVIRLSAFIEQSGKNIQVEMNYKATGSSISYMFISDGAYMSDLCDFAEAMR